ncbi:MAG: NYN domain-containing protein [Candidatus Omnitrophica bacterium]|nr:NYN domain-containing protein [Candidatus Omnitrophota bacterium]
MQCYLLDGYNVLKKLEDLTNGSAKESRKSLINLIATARPQGKNDLIVVFDGHGEEACSCGKIKILFSRNITADEYIIGILKKDVRNKYYRLVSDDKELQFKAKNYGADIIPVSDFVASCFKRKAKYSIGDKERLRSADIGRINKELEEIWLKRKNIG